MKTNIIGSIFEQFIYIAISSTALLIAMASIITGAIYPVQTCEQEMLKSWGLSGIGYIRVLMVFLFGTVFTTAGLYYALKRKPFAKKRSVSDGILSISTMITGAVLAFFVSYPILGRIIYGTWDLYHNSTIIPILALFISTGFVLGTSLVKIVKLWKWKQQWQDLQHGSIHWDISKNGKRRY